MINVDGKNKMEKSDVRGTLAELLSEMEYVISIIYARGMLEEGYDESVVKDAVDFCHSRGRDNALRAIEKFE